jgi:hypothetical protein
MKISPPPALSQDPTPGRSRTSPLLLLPLAAACGQTLELEGSFDGPDGAAILEVGPDSPFTLPVGFVANTRSGRIVPLDLKHATGLGDQAAAPYLPPRSIATGDLRQLGQVAVWSPDGNEVIVFAADMAFGTLVEAQYNQGLDPATGAPEPPTLAASEPVFLDNDDSGGVARVNDLRLRHGWTTTEDWLLAYDGARWWATGSRSGKQASTFKNGERWSSDEREITLSVSGAATSGDHIEFTTDASVWERDVGGTPLSVKRVPDSDLIAVGVWNSEAAEGALVLWNARDRTIVGRLALPDGGQPWRIIVADDASALFVGDARVPRVLHIPFDPALPNLLIAEEIPTNTIVADLALAVEPGDELFGVAPWQRLFVAGVDQARVDIYDLDSQEWMDVNPLDDVHGGLNLRSPVVGLSTAPLPILLQSENDAEIREEARVVLVTTFDGSVRMLNAETGCQAVTTDGPRIASETGYEEIVFNDVGPVSNPALLTDASTGRQVVPDMCGGVIRNEAWTITFDGVQGNWVVEASGSGIQDARAWNDQRYLSDDGALSFLVASGTAPASDGDAFGFTMQEGTLRLDEVLRGGASSAEPVELPAAPLAFALEAGPQGGGWNADRRQVHVLQPVTNSDIVLRIRPQAWETHFIYQ